MLGGRSTSLFKAPIVTGPKMLVEVAIVTPWRANLTSKSFARIAGPLPGAKENEVFRSPDRNTQFQMNFAAK